MQAEAVVLIRYKDGISILIFLKLLKKFLFLLHNQNMHYQDYLILKRYYESYLRKGFSKDQYPVLLSY